MGRREVRFAIVRGGKYAQLRETPAAADYDLDQLMLDAFIGLQGADGTVPSEGIADVRRLRQRPWRYLGRRIREARSQEVPKESVKQIARALDDYIERVYSMTPRRVA
jgi:hypothetical protein